MNALSITVKMVNAGAKRRKVKTLIGVQSRRQFRCEVCGTRLVIFKRDPNLLVCCRDGWALEKSKALAADKSLRKQEEKLIDMNQGRPIIMSIKSTTKHFMSLERNTADDLELPRGAALVDEYEK